MKQKENCVELVLVPWTAIAQMRVSKDKKGDGEYAIKCRRGKLTCFDLSGLIAAPEPGKLQWNPRMIAVENTTSVGWTHRWQGVADNPHLYTAVMKKLICRPDYLLMKREGAMGWCVLGNEYGGEITLRTGGYTSSTEGKWCEGETLSYEFTCSCQQYPKCYFRGETDIWPVEDLFTKF